MTKDWDSVRERIRDLSVNQKKSLEEVKATMETEYRFWASTRAYRMKLKEWGYTRHKSRKNCSEASSNQEEDKRDEERDGSIDQSDASATPTRQVRPQEGSKTLLEEAQDLLPMIDAWSQGGTIVSSVLMDMLAAVLGNDSQELERLILANQHHINLPIGMPFNIPGGRFFNHPAMQTCVILEHPNQTLLDIACALPASSVVWILVANDANGSTHPLGTDLAFHNAIKNGRSITVQSLCFTNRSNVNGTPGTTWRPLLQAVFWNQPDCVKILLDRGANVNDTAPMLDGVPLKTALQLALDRRTDHYSNTDIRIRSEKCLELLLDAGADIHVLPVGNVDALTPWETFINPFQSSSYWFLLLSPTELSILTSFLQNGADLRAHFTGFPCTAPTSATFVHQVLWHTTPTLARLLIDHCSPSPGAHSSHLLHEIVGSCPDAKRHPSDTLRDIEVLIRKGVDLNLPDTDGITPLKVCIDSCPAVDIAARLQALLNGGADLEAKYPDGECVFARAARIFEEPLRSEVLHSLVSKWSGGENQLEVWRQRCFPIQVEPSLADVLSYTNQNDGWAAEIHRLVPEDVNEGLRRAALDVVISNFLDATTQKVKTRNEGLNEQEREDLRHVISLRHTSGLPPYQFDQDLVVFLLTSAPRPHSSPELSSRLVEITEHEMDIDIESPISDTIITHSHPFVSRKSSLLDFPTCVGSNHPMPIAVDRDTPQPYSPSPAPQINTSSDDSVDFLFPTTTQIRWPKVDKGTRPGDLKRAAKRVLRYECKSCTDGNLLTKAEYRKHEEEHSHTVTCVEDGCRRRFCIAERG